MPGWLRPPRWLPCDPVSVRVVVVAALAEATADTLASELGEVLGGPPLLLTTGRRVAPGSNGAVSLAGTLAGTSGAVVVVLVAVFSLGLSHDGALSAGVGAIGGLFVDSLLGATAERRGWLNNDAVNFVSTVAASVLAIVVFSCSAEEAMNRPTSLQDSVLITNRWVPHSSLVLA